MAATSSRLLVVLGVQLCLDLLSAALAVCRPSFPVMLRQVIPYCVISCHHIEQLAVSGLLMSHLFWFLQR